MDATAQAELVLALRQHRAALLKRFFDTEANLRVIGEDREAELEERAQGERAAGVLAALDDRSLHDITEINRALQRVTDATYGRCLDCGGAIPLPRLRALPTAEFCVGCAREEEAARPEATPG